MSEAKRSHHAAQETSGSFRRSARRAKGIDRRRRVPGGLQHEPSRAERLEQRLFLSVVFQNQQTFATGNTPDFVTVADLGNGHPDLIATNQNDQSVSVLLGDGSGNFQAQSVFAVGNTPYAAAVADLGNGHPDIIVTNLLDADVSVLLGNGDGTFQAQQTFATGAHPSQVAVADLGNGQPDLIIANHDDNTVSVLLGNGNGTFQPQTTLAAGLGPQALAVADLGDGQADLVVGNFDGDTVSVFLGNGDGTFQAQQTFATGSGPLSVAAADLGNGIADLIVANANDKTVGVLLGSGDGFFGQQQTFAVGNFPASVAVADLGDGKPDLVVANDGTVGSVSVLQGNGDGTFQGQQTFATGSHPFSVAVADLGDGHPDLVVANTSGNTISVLHGTLATPASVTSLSPSANSVTVGSPLTFTATVSPAIGAGVTPTGTVQFTRGANVLGTAPVQVNGTAVFTTAALPVGLDTISASYSGSPSYTASTSSDVSVTINPLPSVPFQPQQTFATGNNPQFVTVADLGNGHPDLIVANNNDQSVSVLLGDGSGNFQGQQTFAVGAGPLAVAVADLGNGHPDIIVTNLQDADVSVLLGNGDGTFQPQQTFATGNSPFIVAVADLGTGHPDLLVANRDDNTVSVLLGNGDGTFQPQTTLAAGLGPEGLAVADLGNGHADLVAGNFNGNSVSVFLGNGNGTFQAQQTFATGNTPVSVAAGDLGNGHPDLVVVNEGDNSVGVLLGNGDGTFKPKQTFAVGFNADSVAVADLGDGEPDLVVANSSLASVSVLQGNGDGTFKAQQTFAVGANSSSVAVAVVANASDNTVSVLLGALPTPASLTAVSPSVANAIVGNPVTFTAAVSPATGAGLTPAGTVTFTNGASVIGTAAVQSNGTAVFTTTALPAGADSIVASFSGLTYTTSTSFPVTVTISPPAMIGGLNPTFGSGGLASNNVGFVSSSDVLLQPDGRSVIIGTGNDTPSTLGVTRYNADGSVDSSFGNGGTVKINAGGVDQGTAGVLLPNGDILVVGTDTTITNGQPAGSRFILSEFTSAGVLDSSFGGGMGFVLTSFSTTPGTLSNDVAHAIIVSAGGEIFAGGSSDAAGHGQDFAIAAYNPDGSPAAGFGTAGQVLLDFAGGDDSIAALALQPKGSILATGTATAGGVGSVALARFLSNGALDTKFGVKGKVTTSVRGVDDGASSVAVTPKTGALVIGGFSATGSAAAGSLSADFLVLRYTSAGKLDRTFNRTGFAITSFGQPAAITSVLVQSDGTIVATGKSTASLASINPSQLGLAVAKYNANGTAAFHSLFSLSGITAQSLSGALPPQEQPARLVPLDTTSDLMMAFNQLISTAQGASATNTGGQLLAVGNSDGNTVEASIITMGLDLVDALVGSLPHAVIGGAKGTISVQVRETGTQLASGTFSVQLFTVAHGAIAAGQVPFASIAERLKLKQGQSILLHVKFAFPSSLANGNYQIAATIATGSMHDLNTANNTAISAAAVTIAAPFIDLTGSGLSAPAFSGTKPASIAFTVTNNGNIPTPAKSSTLQFLASTDGTLASAVPLATQPFRPNLKASSSHVLRTKLALPSALAAGTYTLLVLLDPANLFNDSDVSNNLLKSGNTFAVG
jgi:uncharacterized delta-60 repeat protein